MAQRRICVVTSGRADYGLLTWPMRAIAEAPDLTLQLIVTGSHLDARSGRTIDAIRADGFHIDAEVSCDLAEDAPSAKARAAAQVLAGAADAFVRLQPDVIVLLGDRFEILACAQAAVLLGVPVVHIGGGDVTEGAFDDSFRHALTKLAHVHLVTHARAAERVRQLGEAADHIHIVGNPGLDALHRQPRLTGRELEQALGAPLGQRNLLVTFHPVTLAPDHGLSELRALLKLLGEQPANTTIWITAPNVDPGHQAIEVELARWAEGRTNVQRRASLGPAYLSLLGTADVVVGNSSSGLTEAASVGTATVDVGLRQAGRTAGGSVFHAAGEVEAIRAALAQALAADMSHATNPYGDGHSSDRIVDVLRALPPREVLLRKPFVDVDPPR